MTDKKDGEPIGNPGDPPSENSPEEILPTNDTDPTS
jgi:hypothetical protein